MRKNIFFKISGIILAVAILAGCETANQDVEPIVSPDGYPTPTFTPKMAYSTVTEGDTIVYNIAIDKQVDRSLTFDAKLVGGTADDHDFVSTAGVIAPYTSTTSVTVVIPEDWDAESDETMQLEFGMFAIADRYIINHSTVNPVLNLTVKNFVSDILTTTISWDQPVVVQDIIDVKVDVGTYFVVLEDTIDVDTDAADEVDWDFYVSEAAGFDIMDPWSSNIVAAAATGDSPEVLELEGLDNGEYVIWSDLWANGIIYYFDVTDPTIEMPIVSNYMRQGTTLNIDVEQAASQVCTVVQPGYDDDGIGFNGIVSRFKVQDGKYIVVKTDGTDSTPYRSGTAPRTPRPSQYVKTR